METEMIRDWITPAYRSWMRTMYGGRGIFFVGGCLMWIVIPFIAIKAAIFWSVVVVMCALFLITGAWDMATYRRRVRASQEATS